MNRTIRLRDGSTLDVLGLAALAALLLAIGVAAYVVVPLISLYKHPPVLEGAQANAQDLLAEHRKLTEQQALAFNEHHLFYPPAPPELPPPPRGREYDGPPLIAYVNGTAWFTSGDKVSAKDPQSGQFKFVRSNAPWSVVVQYRGVEYDVPLFKKTDLVKLKETVALPTRYTPPPPGSGPRGTLPDGAGPGAAQPGAQPGPTAIAPAQAIIIPESGTAPPANPAPPPAADPGAAPGAGGPAAPPQAPPGSTPTPPTPPNPSTPGAPGQANPSQGSSDPPREPASGSDHPRPSQP